MKKWWIILIIGLLIIGIIFVLSFILFLPNTNTNDKLGNNDTCLNITSLNEKYDCYSYLAYSNNNPDFCLKIPNNYKIVFNIRGKCFRDIAIKQINDKLCYSITDIESKDICYRDISKKILDDSFCEKINSSETKDECYYNLGIYKINSVLCNKIKNKAYNPGIGSASEEECNEIVGWRLGQSNSCDYFSLKNINENCNLDLAKIMNNDTICNKLNNSSQCKEIIKTNLKNCQDFIKNLNFKKELIISVDLNTSKEDISHHYHRIFESYNNELKDGDTIFLGGSSKYSELDSIPCRAGLLSGENPNYLYCKGIKTYYQNNMLNFNESLNIKLILNIKDRIYPDSPNHWFYSADIVNISC